METYLKRLLKYLAIYIVFWFMMTQINGFAAYASLYFPIFWVFVYFPATQHAWQSGLAITVLSGIFLESQYTEIRGLYLPLMLVIFLALHFRRSRVVDSKTSTHLGLASIVHWILILIPTAILQALGRVVEDPHLLWQRTLQDGVSGQLLLLLIFPVLSVGFVMISGRQLGEEGSISM